MTRRLSLTEEDLRSVLIEQLTSGCARTYIGMANSRPECLDNGYVEAAVDDLLRHLIFKLRRQAAQDGPYATAEDLQELGKILGKGALPNTFYTDDDGNVVAAGVSEGTRS